MAITKNLIVTSGSVGSGDNKAFIRIGDLGPSSPNLTSSAIQFLQLIGQNGQYNFDNAGTTSAFRIRHDTLNGALIFQGRTGSSGIIHSLLQFQDQGTVKFTAPVTFESIGFEDILAGQITSSYLHIYSQSQLEGTTSIINGANSTQLYTDANGNLVFQNDGNTVIFDGVTMSFSSSGFTSTASIWYDGTQLHIDGFQASGGGNSWKTQYMITASYLSSSTYTIYTESATQIIQHYPYLSVYCNGSLMIQSGSGKSHWDYKPGSDSSSIQFRYNLPYSVQDQFYLSYVYNGGSV